MITAWNFLRELNTVCHFQTCEGKKSGAVSASELKRWCMNRVLHINGEVVSWDEVLDFPIISVVLFPNNQVKRCTLY
jgi:hypothetical protein